MAHLVLGTAGHIDHGKTSLIRALTGVDCDRLPEERARGITIDLGFTSLDLGEVQFGVVDVPGHERFVHNMVAGATGIDLALLVIACDDSVMPQTVEHLAILDLLGIRAGVIALTKRDLVDDEHFALVREEVEELVSGTFLENAPVVPVASTTGLGLEHLRAALIDAARNVVDEGDSDRLNGGGDARPFRMPVDRAFTLAGHGTVVTGTVRSGATHTGETLQLLPASLDVRIRSLQTHGVDSEAAGAGRRTAVNLAGVKLDDVARGDELTTPGCFEPTRRLLVKLQTLATEKRPLKHRQLVRLHVAAREVTARIMTDGEPLGPGAEGYAVVKCASPVIAEYGQKFILRRLSPVETIGGGRVLATDNRRRTRHLLEAAPALDAGDPAQRLPAWLDLLGEDALAPEKLWISLGINPAERDALLEQLIAAGQILPSPGKTGRYMSNDYKEKLKAWLVRGVERELERRRPARLVDRTPILTAAAKRTASATVIGLLDELVKEGRLLQRGERIGAAGDAAQLTQRESDVLNRLVKKLDAAGPSPPSLKEFSTDCDLSIKQLEPLVQVAVDQGRVVRVSPDLVVAPEQLDELRRRAVEWMANHGPATVAQIKDHWNVSRKYAVPYLEFFDEVGVTRRDADKRTAGPNADRPLEEWLP
ncbi:MAG: selenocysteine-specific translation elongation factor [Planctomycetota bacterium]|nr:MAG: selenocysteine-specific translation elongation factor [Planctomycetota bacterium]REK34055.1 MAG: selenocysteine-specific translation elongation factor [Planctomycetota bacterium]